MDALTLARWQFGITTVYHFFFVPLTLGLVWVVAVLHTAWYVTGQEVWKRLTKFWGKLFLINFAMGVVTGIVQEFQFGMNWSEYSRFVGDVFGAPLAIEALLAFFLESTFLGPVDLRLGQAAEEGAPRLHLAGRDRLEPLGALDPHRELLHAAADGLRAAQRPGGDGELLGARHEPARLRAVPPRDHGRHGHRRLLRARASAPGTSSGPRTSETRDAFRRSFRIGAVYAFVATVAVMVVGHTQAQYMITRAADEDGGGRGAVGDREPGRDVALHLGRRAPSGKDVWAIKVPGLLSFLAYNRFDGEVKGIQDIQAEYEAKYGPGDYVPPVKWTYWTFRAMVGRGDGDAAPGRLGALRDAARAASRASPRLLALPRARDRAALHGQQHGLDLHRDRPGRRGSSSA